MAKGDKKHNRKLHQPGYKSFRLQKKIKSTQPELPSSWGILKSAFNVIRDNKRYFIGILILYGIFNILFIRSSSNGVDIVGLKNSFHSVLGQSGELASNVALFGVLLGSNNAGTGTAGVYQILILLVFSLALIFGLRQIFSSSREKPSVKRSLYEGMAPLIPIILVLSVIGLQLLPLSIGSSLYATVVTGGLAVSTLEKFLWLVMLILLSLLTVYMLSSSIFALYIVTLPGMTPMKALRSALDLVKYRRWTVMRKVIVLPIFLLLIFGLIVIPFIAFLPRFAELTYFLLTLLLLPLVHTYIYSLYRKLL